jgi:hypothetical protein
MASNRIGCSGSAYEVNILKPRDRESERKIGGIFQANGLIISVYRISLIEDLSSAH